MPTWWLIGVALFIPMFLWAVVDGVRKGEYSVGTAISGTAFFLGTGVASGFYWFG